LDVLGSSTPKNAYRSSDNYSLRLFLMSLTLFSFLFFFRKPKREDEGVSMFQLSILITPLTLSLLCRLLPVRLGGSIVKLSEFYSYRLIGKLTLFFPPSGVHLSTTIWLRNLPVTSSTSTECLSLNNSKTGLTWLSFRRQLYVLRLI
jgi:hypothetical protein